MVDPEVFNRLRVDKDLQAGSIGTENNPNEDGYFENLTVTGAATGVGGGGSGVVHASDYVASTADGGAAIQAALDELGSAPSTVVVGPQGPDDYTAGNGDSYSDVWALSSVVEAPSNTTVLWHGDAVLKDNTGDNLIRNKGIGQSGRDANIHLIGVGRPYLDQRPGQQGRTANSVEYLGIRLYQVDDCTISNFELRTTSYAVRPEDVTDLRVSNLWFDQDDAVNNQDGLHIVGPTSDFSVDGLHGVTYDDLCALECGAFSVPLDGASGSVEDGTIRNLTGDPRDGAPGASLKFIGGNAGTISNVTASDITVKGRRGVEFEDYVGGGSDPAQDTESGIVVSNISTGRAGGYDSLVHFIGGVSNVQVHGITGDINTINGIVVVEEDVHNVQISDMQCLIRSGGKLLEATNNALLRDFSLSDCEVRNQAGGRFIFVESGSTLDDFRLTDSKADGFDTFLEIAGSGTGTIINNETVAVTTDYNGLASLKFVGDNPPHDSAAPAVKGSEVIATASWDPDGDGNAERVQYDGTAWQEVVDLPGW